MHVFMKYDKSSQNYHCHTILSETLSTYPHNQTLVHLTTSYINIFIFGTATTYSRSESDESSSPSSLSRIESTDIDARRFCIHCSSSVSSGKPSIVFSNSILSGVFKEPVKSSVLALGGVKISIRKQQWF